MSLSSKSRFRFFFFFLESSVSLNSDSDVSDVLTLNEVTYGRRGSRDDRAEADVPDKDGNRGLAEMLRLWLDGFRSSASSCGVTVHDKS